jgi:hypothetical protein
VTVGPQAVEVHGRQRILRRCGGACIWARARTIPSPLHALGPRQDEQLLRGRAPGAEDSSQRQAVAHEQRRRRKAMDAAPRKVRDDADPRNALAVHDRQRCTYRQRARDRIAHLAAGEP